MAVFVVDADVAGIAGGAGVAGVAGGVGTSSSAAGTSGRDFTRSFKKSNRLSDMIHCFL